MWLDSRIEVLPVAEGEAPEASEGAVLVRIGMADAAAPSRPGWAAVRELPVSALVGHAADCRCCSGRSGLADALSLLFVQRARMQLPFFNRVVIEADQKHLHDVVTILANDSAVTGRFRPESRK